jgi:hypothetical protein
MTSRRFIHQSFGYGSVVYYATLSFFALYELLVSSDSLSIFVSAPLFFAFAIFGVVLLILNFVAAVASFPDLSNQVMKEYGGSWAVALLSFFFCYLIYINMDPAQQPQLFETPALYFVLFPVVDVFIRSILYQPSKEAGESAFLERLGYVQQSFPVGLIALFTFFAGGWLLGLLLAPRSELPVHLFAGVSLLIMIFFLPVEFLNRGIGKSGLHRDEFLNPSYWWGILGRGLRSNRPYPRAWNPWLSLIAAILFTLSSFLLAHLLFQTNEKVRIVATLMWLTYSFLALWRFYEAQGQQTTVKNM